MNILTINAGSSSIKFKIFRYHNKNKTTLLLSGNIIHIKEAAAKLSIKTASTESTVKLVLVKSNIYQSAIEQLCQNVKFSQISIDRVVNRVVYGGDEYTDIVLLHRKTLANLSKYNQFAPLHQPYNLLIAEYFMDMYPTIKHYACFDTGFHQTVPLVNRAYAIPWQYTIDGVKRYGSYGLSCSYIAKIIPSLVEHKLAKGRWIVAHLGSGSSICGIKNGKSMVSSMGFSTVEGLPMATCSGELDLSIPLYLKDKYRLADQEIQKILYEQSGLFGLSNGISGDMEVLLKSKDARAKFAVEFYVIQVAAYITKLVTILGGMNGIVFTGEIGEKSPVIRMLIIEHLEWLGVRINKKTNNNNKFRISKKDAKFKILVVPTNEELAMVNQLIEHKL